MDIKDVAMAVKLVKKINDTNKDVWREEIYRKRWKNFLTVWIYIAVCLFFVWIGFWQRASFYSVVHWWFYMFLAAVFLILGLITMFSYLGIIIKGKK